MLRMSNEHLKEVDALKTGFLNMVSHDMRTPLTSIVGFAGLLRKRARMAAKPPPGARAAGSPPSPGAWRRTRGSSWRKGSGSCA